MTTFGLRRPLTVTWGDCDLAGIVFNACFFEMFDASAWQLFGTVLGIAPQGLPKTYDIVGIALVNARTEFRKTVKFGDLIEIASRVSEFRRSSLNVERKISVAGKRKIPKNFALPRFPPRSSRASARRCDRLSRHAASPRPRRAC
jgi:4-hydroxybenzoyl-CoA thioesterase